MFLVCVPWNVITHTSEFSVTLSNFLIFAMRTTGLANLILVLVYQKKCHKFTDVPSNVFFLVSLLLYPELSRVAFCGHGYEHHAL